MKDDNIKVLLIEDNPADVRIVREMLAEVKETKFKISSEKNLCEGIEQAKKERPDVVILDLNLPDSNGMNTFKTFSHELPELPIILLTGTDDETLGLAAIREGVQDYIVKGKADGDLLSRSMRYSIGRKNGELAIRDREQRLRMITDNMMDVILQTDIDGIIKYASPSNKWVFGYEQNMAIGKSVYHFLHPDDIAVTTSALEKSFEKGDIKGTEVRVRHLNGSYVWVETTGKLIIDDEGKPLGTVLICRDISDRKIAEEKLKESELRYRHLFENMLEGVFQSNTDGKILMANNTLAKMLGYDSIDELKDLKNIRDSYTIPSQRDAFLSKLEKDGKITNFELKLNRKDGQVITALVNAYVLKNNQDKSILIEGTFNDITDRIKIELAMKESEEKFRSLFESSRDAIMTIEPPSWKFTSGNPTTIKMFGAKDEGEFKTFGPGDVSPERQPDGRPSDEKAMEMIEKAIRDNSNFFEWTHKRINGDVFPATVLLSRLERAGKLVVQATVRDITENKRIEEILIRSEEKHKTIFNLAPDAILILDLDGNIIDINDYALNFAGLSRKDIIGKSFTELKYISQSEIENFVELLPELLDGKSLEPIKLEVTTARGESRWLENRIGTLKKDGELSSIIVVARDITDRVKAEEKLRQSEEMFRNIFKSSPEAITIADVKGTILDCNEAAIEIFEVSDKNEILNTNLSTFFDNNKSQQSMDRLKDIVLGKPLRGMEINYVNKKGRELQLEMSASIIRDAQGIPILFMAINKDITERKNAEEEKKIHLEQLIQSEKMSSIGQLIAGIAHEINNPLTAILGYSMELSRQMKDASTDKIKFFEHFPQDLDTIKEAAERCSKITHALLAYARMSTFMKTGVNINETIDSTLLFLNPQMRMHRVMVVKNMDNKIRKVLGNSTELQQVIINLLINASDSMPNGGQITITTYQSDNGNVMFSIEDNGCGIPKENLGRIFEPFYTTKAPGKSTGLGLAVVDGIIKSHNGTIKVESVVDKGTKFIVSIPAFEEEMSVQGQGGDIFAR